MMKEIIRFILFSIITWAVSSCTIGCTPFVSQAPPIDPNQTLIQLWQQQTLNRTMIDFMKEMQPKDYHENPTKKENVVERHFLNQCIPERKGRITIEKLPDYLDPESEDYIP